MSYARYSEPDPDDLALVLDKLRGLVGDVQTDVVTFVHAGAPISKARARGGKFGFYTPERTRVAERSVFVACKTAMLNRPTFTDTVAIVAMFFRPDRRRIDGDNLMKLVMDAATKAKVWKDDSQATAQAAIIEIDPHRPRTVVAIAPYRSSMTRQPLLLQEGPSAHA
jgi:Holliday junction resolvase RusA-like endonuclease